MKNVIWFLFICVMAFSAFAQEVQRLEWERPTERENGETLTVEELGGYEIRAALPDGTQQVFLVEDGTATGLDLTGLGLPDGDYTFEIAAFDINGLYSQFVSLSPTLGGSPANSPAGAEFIQSFGDPVTACEASTSCVVVQSILIIR